MVALFLNHQHSLLIFVDGGVINVISINLEPMEYYNSEENQFHHEEGGVVRFEYSLKALYEWEGKWGIPFMSADLTSEQAIDFYMSMALDPIKKSRITNKVAKILSNYISKPNTATTFSSAQNGQNGNNNSSNKVYTAEEIYALMVMANVPLEFEHRNLNRLLTTLRIISAYNSPPKKMSKEDIYRQNSQLNAARKKQLNTKG